MAALTMDYLKDKLTETSRQQETGLGSRIHALFAEVGGVELTLPERSAPRSMDFGNLSKVKP